MTPKQYLFVGLAFALIASHTGLAFFARDYGKDQERLKWQEKESRDLHSTLQAVSSIQASADALKVISQTRRSETAQLNRT